MKITAIETLPVSVGPSYDYAVIIVLVRTDEGLTGIGEASLAGRGRGVLGILGRAVRVKAGPVLLFRGQRAVVVLVAIAALLVAFEALGRR